MIDLDVHQGDGTATIFSGEDRVYTFSMHCERNFPSRKAVSDLDISMPDDIDDEGYMYLLERQLDRLYETVRPDLVYYNAGVDIYRGDKLGNLLVSLEGLGQRDTEVISTSKRHRVPLVVVPGGGYGKDINEVASRHLITFRAAASVFCS